MTYEIEIQDAPQRDYVAVAHECGRDDFESRVEQTLTDVWTYVDEAGSGPAGAPFSVLLDLDLESDIPPPSPWHLESGFPTLEPVAVKPPFRRDQLPGGRLLVTTHRGDYEGLLDAFLALQVHLLSEGLEPAGPPWAAYLTDPVQDPEPSQWRTLVCWPVE